MKPHGTKPTKDSCSTFPLIIIQNYVEIETQFLLFKFVYRSYLILRVPYLFFKTKTRSVAAKNVMFKILSAR